jgi:leucyl aminopeptidase
MIVDFNVSRIAAFLGSLLGLAGTPKTEEYFNPPDPRVVVVPNYPSTDSGVSTPWRFADRPLSQQKVLTALFSEVSEQKLRATVTKLVSYNNRYYLSTTGRESILWYASQFREIATRRQDVEVLLQEHAGRDEARRQPTLIVRMRGQNSELQRERLIVGTPGDCINSVTGMGSVDDPCPGADDNASGMAVVLEAFRVLVALDIRPQRTLEFIAYAGEELGLIGSHYVSQSYAVDKVDVAGVLQLEGTMYPGPEPKIALVSDFTHPQVTTYLARLVEAYVGVPHVLSPCGYGCSDHAPWKLQGFPVGFPYSEIIGHDNPYAHTPQDTLDRLSFEHGLRFTRLTLAFLVELGLVP